MLPNSKMQRFYTLVSRYHNSIGQYEHVGELLTKLPEGMVAFAYSKDYLSSTAALLDPVSEKPKDKGLVYVASKDGKLNPYFRSYLPKGFRDRLLTDIVPDWRRLNEFQKLYVLTESVNHFGALGFNTQFKASWLPITDERVLAELIKAIREFESGQRTSQLVHNYRGALLSMGGNRPKVEFRTKMNTDDDSEAATRWVLKLETSPYFDNESRVNCVAFDCIGATATSLVNHRSLRVKANGETVEELFATQNYARTKFRHSDGQYDIHDDGRQMVFLYNRIDMRTLLDAENEKNSQFPLEPNYKSISTLINWYSADPQSDRTELFRRAFLTASLNLTNNDLDNLEMYDKSVNEWRLAPMYSGMPNPDSNAEFDTAITEDTQMEHGEAFGSRPERIDADFVASLANNLNVPHITAKVEAERMARQVVNQLNVSIEQRNLSESDASAVKSAVRTQELMSLATELGNDFDVKNANRQNQTVEVIEQDASKFLTQKKSKSSALKFSGL